MLKIKCSIHNEMCEYFAIASKLKLKAMEIVSCCDLCQDKGL